MGLTETRCLTHRRRMLDISQKATVHLAPAFSCIEIVDAIYHDLKREQDVFLMSKGHGCLAQYVVLEDLGVMPKGELDRYCSPEGILGGHPDKGCPGISASTGALGHGLGMGVGMAYAEMLKGADTDVYVLGSDGELQEGSTWEAVLTAANLYVENLVLFVDFNDFGCFNRMSAIHPAVYPVAEKFRAFGWESVHVEGHDAEQIIAAARGGHRPLAVICHTVKGKGVSFMEKAFARGDGIWHYKSPSAEEYAQAMMELEGSA